MSESRGGQEVLSTTAGDVPLAEYRLGLRGREWRILHSGSVLSTVEEAEFVGGRPDQLPFGVALWPAAIALAHELVARGEELRGARVLELGAGTGLPGIVAASLGARVVQTDRHEVPMHLCRRNAERNGLPGIEHRLVDWADWRDPERYDWILGSDVLYGRAGHPHLRRIFATALAPGGRILLSDPFREASFRLLEPLEEEGWSVSVTQWNVGVDDAPRPVGVYEIVPPGPEMRPG